MEQVTIERAGAPQGSPAFLTWRDAVTPFGRGSRRRWVAMGVLVLAVVGVTMRWGVDLGYRDDSDFGPPGTGIVILLVLLGVVREATGGVAALDHPELDERDLGARNAAFRVAYPLLLLVMGASFVVVAFTGSDADFDSSVSLGLLFWAALWAVFLPMAVLAWREPDEPEPDVLDPAEGAGASEPLRDGVVALTFAAALVLDLVVDSGGLGLVVLVAGLTVLAAWKRWAVGQQAVAAGLQNLGLFVGILCVAGLIFVAIDRTADTAGVVSLAVGAVVGVALVLLGRPRKIAR